MTQHYRLHCRDCGNNELRWQVIHGGARTKLTEDSAQAIRDAATLQPLKRIGEIREVIRGATWTRNDLTDGTAEEFKRQKVGPRLTEKIAELQSLQIPARFADDIAQRDREIERCNAVIARWNEAQHKPVCPPKISHAFLGEPRCVKCGVPYADRSKECHGQRAPELSSLVDDHRRKIILL